MLQIQYVPVIWFISDFWVTTDRVKIENKIRKRNLTSLTRVETSCKEK